MTVEHVRTTPANRAPARRPVTGAARAAGPTYPPSPRVAPGTGPLCLVVPEIADGDGHMLVRSLRRRESTRAVLLTRKSGRRELVVLLGGGVRGAVTAESPGAVRIAAKPPVAPPAPGPELTARELGVLGLVAQGRSNRQIGEHLDLSALTVKSHLARISRKVGTGDRAEMVAYAIRNELLA
ncbi:LuxR C-terminal-related transcriptional regulator [Actinotalea sp. JY-7885]|uniref:helix-turn-helix transcriptional regulator n=2 Tax=unclassified Actinotalea TaxID=2638618 RepID=UPI00281682EA|nr:LuxR C-terminal-related transcriptional regulator [Actinotalea sp. JY-7885]